MSSRTLALAASFVVASAVTGATRPATAADRTPLSALPVGARLGASTAPSSSSKPIQGITLEEQGPRSVLLTAAKGYCIATERFGFDLWNDALYTRDATDELWRLVERDERATLERVRFEVVTESKTLRVLGRQSTELYPAAREGGVTVWAFREAGGPVVLLARGTDIGRESDGLQKDGDGFPSTRSSCAFGAVRVRTSRASAGATAELQGTLPATGTGADRVTPTFWVHASLAKLSRDPEPVLAVRVRRVP